VESRGSRSCVSWQEHRFEQADGHAYSSEIDQTWLVGYLSGVVAGSGIDFLVGTDNEMIFAMADEYCQMQPRGQLAAAGTSLARGLMQQKGLVNIPTQR
jgi:hypothetical protein